MALPEIDPQGPVDPTLVPQRFSEVDRPAAFTLMAPGWWPAKERITQAYGLCFTADGMVVVVRHPEVGWTLPGGTIERGEQPADTLAREVREEACARVIGSRYLASQHVWDPESPDDKTSYYQSRFWARVDLSPWVPCHEMVERRLVVAAAVAATVSWRDKLILRRLIEQALQVDGAQRGLGPGSI